MAHLIIVFWRDIPAQVIVRAGRKAEKRELPERFIHAIDRAAMRSGAKDSDTYLAQWRRADAVPVTDDLGAEADRAMAAIVADYGDARLKTLVDNGGWVEATMVGSPEGRG